MSKKKPQAMIQKKNNITSIRFEFDSGNGLSWHTGQCIGNGDKDVAELLKKRGYRIVKWNLNGK